VQRTGPQGLPADTPVQKEAAEQPPAPQANGRQVALAR
jgi:hypothetical protein